jgi:hypothetical protein
MIVTTIQSLLTNYINNITLSNRTITMHGPTPEDQALTYLIVNDTTFNFSQLLTLNSMMDNMVQFRIRQRYAVLTWLWQTTATTNNNNLDNYGQECDVSRITCVGMDLGGRVGPQNVVQGMDWYRINIPGGGTIPADLGLLTAMTSFGVGQSTLTGTLPASIGQWTALTYLDIFSNALTGTLPESIGQWTRLEMFIASSNQLTGTLPVSIGRWTALTYFDVSGNGLTGTLPVSMVNWSKIQSALFNNNQFMGTMPVGICPFINRTIGDRLIADCQSEINCTCCTQCV